VPESIAQYRGVETQGQMLELPPAYRSSFSRSARRAAPRCEIAFFSSSESSAIVRPGVACGQKSGS